MKKTFAVIAFAGVFALGGAALADDDRRPPPGGGMFPVKEIDANEDGAITRAELEAFQTARFAELDADEDGSLTREELEEGAKNLRQPPRGEDGPRRGGRGGRPGAGFDRLDENDDGVLSEEEFSVVLETIFEKIDADEDGVVTEDELKEAREAFRGRRRR